MLGATTDGLHRSPHVAFAGHEVPTSGQEFISFDAPTFINGQGLSVAAIRQYFRPHYITVSLDYGVSAAEFVCFTGIECGVNASEDDIGATLAGQFADLVTAQGVRSMDTDADYVAGTNLAGIHGFQR